MRAPGPIFVIFYRPQTKFTKVMFLYLSVILFHRGGGCLPQCMLGYTPPREQTSPLSWPSPREQTPPRSRHPPPSRWLLLWTVRILLECILVMQIFTSMCQEFCPQWACIPECNGQGVSAWECAPLETQRKTPPPEMKHPTGMHSCLKYVDAPLPETSWIHP